mgnify:CR=1 FL=1
MVTKAGEVVEIKFVGKLEDGMIFDLNDKEVAAKEGLKGHFHSKTIICLGQGDVVAGLDESLVGKEVGKKLEVSVEAEKGFGKRNADLFHMIPLSKFKDHKINPMPGLQVNIDDNMGVVKSVSGGRVLVDFNHPLAGKTLKYEVTIVRVVEDLAEKIQGFLELMFHLHDAKVEAKEGNVVVKHEVPKEFAEMLEGKLKERYPELKSLKFEK